MTTTVSRLTPHPLSDGHPPEWASAWGHDQYGPFVEFEVWANDDKSVSQRMRWIAPGRFLIGSPATEQGRYYDEGPQHEVMITQGYWLFDTPCTQELWLAVMGSDNPSCFPDPKRPVEQVSFEDVEQFLMKINGLVAGLNLALPSEAQWEYACRAGTTTATYAGDLQILGENNAPVLDPIAWYGGNSGHEYDHDKFWGSSSWPEKQYPHERAGTRKVASKLPNSWGLYDMLGNVWEWCGDWYDPKAYLRDDCADPVGPETGSERVVRGGSWLLSARFVRAAQRHAYSPEYRFNRLGFRCLSSVRS